MLGFWGTGMENIFFTLSAFMAADAVAEAGDGEGEEVPVGSDSMPGRAEEACRAHCRVPEKWHMTSHTANRGNGK